MKKHTEKPPIDELFARKLGNMSLPSSPDGFERLQARMGQHKPEARVVFWRSPDLQRYMAIAACLLLVCLFGWLYWPSGKSVTSGGQQVAANQSSKSPLQKRDHQLVDQPSEKSVQEAATSNLTDLETSANQVAVVDRPVVSRKEKNDENGRSTVNPNVLKAPVVVQTEPVLAQAEPVNTPTKTNTPTNQSSVNQPVIEQLAENKPIVKSTQVSERVLDVTIAEPEALVAARQAAAESVLEKPAVATNEKLPKESKGGNFWQQVKRIKQGEIFARHDNPANDERGLLGRAYSGLKQSFDKDKSAKQ